MLLHDVVQSIDVTQILIAALGGVGASFLWIKRRYLSIGAWLKEKEAKRVMFNELPQRVVDFAQMLDGVRVQTDKVMEALNKNSIVLAGHGEALDSISAMIYGEMELDSAPRFICNSDGSNINVNTAYARLVGCGRDELIGFGYQRFIAEDINPKYFADFDNAVEQHHSFEHVVRIKKPDGATISAHVRIVPHPEGHAPAHFWIGSIVQVSTSENNAHV